MTLNEAIKEKNVEAIRKIASELPVADIADLLEEMQPTERVIFFRLLNTSVQSDIFSQLEPEYQQQLIEAFSDKQIEEIVGDLFADEIADLIEDVPPTIAARILKNTPKSVRNDVNKILRYDEDQVGSVMTVDIINLEHDMTIGESLKLIKERKEEEYVGHYFFVVDKGVLVGSVKLEDLVFARDKQQIKEFAKPTGFVYVTTNKEEAAIEFADQNQSVLPVVDEKRRVIGVITSDDMIDVVQEAAQEDFQIMAGISHNAEVPYSRTKITAMFKSRVVWLMLLMLSSTISQIVLDFAQNESDRLLTNPAIWTTAIVAILPVISGAAGNAGSQTSTLVIRGLATGDITNREYRKVMWKEVRVASLVGGALAIANFARLIVYYSAKGDMTGASAIQHLALSGAASVALFLVIVLAKTTGGALPLLAKKFRMDPAVMAAPLLTTLIDALSTIIFFSISIGIMILVL